MHSKAYLMLVAFCLSACSAQSQNESVLGDPSTLYRVNEGRVLSVREVAIDETPGTNTGAVAGAAAGGFAGGAALGGQLGPGGALVGGAAGAAVGYLIEEVITVRDGIEYLVEMDNGQAVTIVQDIDEGETPIPENTEVYVQTSRFAIRVVERSEGIGPFLQRDWHNPDDQPLDASAGPTVQIKRRRTGTYYDLHDRPPKPKGPQADTTYWPSRPPKF